MEWRIPADAVTEKGKSGSTEAPPAGGKVTFTVDAQVSRAAGGDLYVTPLKINETELAAGTPGGKPGGETWPTREELLAELQKADGDFS